MSGKHTMQSSPRGAHAAADRERKAAAFDLLSVQVIAVASVVLVLGVVLAFIFIH